MPRISLIPFALAFASCLGCSTKQDYEIVPYEHRDALLADNPIVVEGVVTHSSRAFRPTLSQRIFFFIPMGVSTKNPAYNAAVAVDTVLKGDGGPRTIRLRDYRRMRREEHALFVDGLGLHMNSRVRLGFTRRRGDRLDDLEIAPLGNTPGFDEAMREAWRRVNERAASRPTSRPTSRPSSP